MRPTTQLSYLCAADSSDLSHARRDGAAAELALHPAGGAHYDRPSRVEVASKGSHRQVEDQPAVGRQSPEDRPVRHGAAGVATPPLPPAHGRTRQGAPATCRSHGPRRAQARGTKHVRGGRQRIGAEPVGTRSSHHTPSVGASPLSSLLSLSSRPIPVWVGDVVPDSGCDKSDESDERWGRGRLSSLLSLLSHPPSVTPARSARNRRARSA